MTKGKQQTNIPKRTADTITLQMFRQLTDFTRDVVQAIYAEKADGVG
jgi:hypothetical protein